VKSISVRGCSVLEMNSYTVRLLILSQLLPVSYWSSRTLHRCTVSLLNCQISETERRIPRLIHTLDPNQRTAVGAWLSQTGSKEESQGTKHEEQGSRAADPTLQLAKRSAGNGCSRKSCPIPRCGRDRGRMGPPPLPRAQRFLTDARIITNYQVT
jgi:hypothetical protein